MPSTSKHSETDLRQSLVDVSRRMLAARLNCGTAGNASARCGDGLLITPSGSNPLSMQAGDCVRLSAQGDVVGPGTPSSEWRFHRDLYQARPEAGAVVHMHSPFATALACQRRDVLAFHYTVARFGGDDVRCAPYAPFASAELSQTIVAAMKDRSACLMANHGATVIGRNLDDALDLAIELEFLCELYWRSLQGGAPVLLTAGEMDDIGMRYRDYCRPA